MMGLRTRVCACLLVALATSFAGTGAALAKKPKPLPLHIYGPGTSEPTLPLPVRLEAAEENPGLLTGIVFLVGHTGASFTTVAECPGYLTGELIKNNLAKDKVKLTGAVIGSHGTCDSYGFAIATMSGFPKTLVLAGATGPQKIGTLEVTLSGVSGLPSTCTYFGKLPLGASSFGGPLTMNLESGGRGWPALASTPGCEELEITDPGVVRGYGPSEPLYTELL